MLSFKDIQWEVGSPWRWGLSILFFIYLDLYILENNMKYLMDALRLLRKPKEFFYFLKVVISHSLNLLETKKNNFQNESLSDYSKT